jgi:serine/threonine protein kinase
MGAELIKDNKGKDQIFLTKEKFSGDEIVEKDREAYDILAIIGRGEDNCFTYKVFSKINNKVYAMKEINLNYLSEERIKQLNDVLTILKENKCPNIIKNYAFFEKNDNLYIINEFAENGDLQDLVKSYKFLGKTIKKKKLWSIFLQCASSLKYIHSKNIIHRNIRLENFLMADNGVIKLANFKNAILLKDKQKEKNIINDNENYINEEKLNEEFGGILYRSPEKENSDYGKKTDIYSLGVVFYILCFHDFPKNEIHENKINYKDYEDYISPVMIKIIESMLDKEEKRPDADKLYFELYYSYINKVVKNTSIKSVFTCINAYHKKYLDNEKDPFELKYIKNIEQLKLNGNNFDYNLEINDFRNLMINNYAQNNNNDQEINPIIVLNCLLEQLNKETSNDKNGHSFKIKPNNFDIKSILKKSVIENNDDYKKFINGAYDEILKTNNYNSIISKYFIGLFAIIRFCKKCQKELYDYSICPYVEFDLDKCYNEKKEYEPNIEEWFILQFKHISEKKNIYCENCKCITTQNESKSIVRFPENLIIAINRGDDYNNQSEVKYSEEINLGGTIFKLIGVVKRMVDKGGEEYFISFHLEQSNDTWVVSEREKEENKKRENKKGENKKGENKKGENKKEVNPIKHEKGIVMLLFYLLK